MGKEEAISTISNLWKPITTIVAILIMGAVGLAKIDMLEREIMRVDREGCKQSHLVLQRLPIIETESIRYREDITEIKADIKEIKSLLMSGN